MNDSEDAREKTSRRRFAKSAASALVAMPVISALTSCAKKEPQPPSPPGTPTPQPTGTPMMESSNPPIIIDGGSLSISLDTRLKQQNTGIPPRPWKHTQEEPRYGAITKVRLMNEVGDQLHDDFAIAAGASLELKIWLQTASPENPFGEVTYDPAPAEPQFLLTNTGTGGTFEIRYPEKIDNPDKLHKTKRPHKKYRREKLATKFFRIGKVGVAVGAINYETPESAADNGFRIVVFLKDGI